jgi:hypothetical protein
MTTNTVQPSANTSAKIYVFPARGRYAAALQDEVALAPNVQLPRGAKLVASTGAWYHEQAIQDERRKV